MAKPHFGNTDLYDHDPGHTRRCDDSLDVDSIRCPVCKGRGKVPYTFGPCTYCRNVRDVVLGCPKHKKYFKLGE